MSPAPADRDDGLNAREPNAATPRISRRRFLGLAGTGSLAAAAAIGGYSFGIAPNRNPVTLHSLQLRTDSTSTLRLIQLSDLHLQDVGWRERRVAGIVGDLAPHVVALTGDTIDRADAIPLLDSFLALLPGSASIYSVLGNWERWTHEDMGPMRAAYTRRGARLLINESVLHEHAGRTMLITGLDDLVSGLGSIETALAGFEPHPAHLVLAHCPAHRDVWRAWRSGEKLELHLNRPADPVEGDFSPGCMLAGHTHGGQLRLLGWSPILPWGSGAYVSGWYRGGFPELYVSRGLGTTIVPARLGAPPEIAVFDIRI